MTIQYIPAYLIKHLTTPESIAHESVRRKLKAAVADAAKAVQRFRNTPCEKDALPLKDVKVYENFLGGKTKYGHRLIAPIQILPEATRKELRTFANQRTELERRYQLYTAYTAARANDRATRDALIQAEDAARQAYKEHLATPIEGYSIPESDLE